MSEEAFRSERMVSHDKPIELPKDTLAWKDPDSSLLATAAGVSMSHLPPSDQIVVLEVLVVAAQGALETRKQQIERQQQGGTN